MLKPRLFTLHRSDLMRLVCCDTDFLIKIANDPLPKFDFSALSRQNSFCTLPCVVRELSNLKSSRYRSTARRSANALRVVGLGQTAKVRQLTREDFNGVSWMVQTADADQALMEFVMEDPITRMVATLDGSLLSAFERKDLPYLTLRSGRDLMVDRGATHLSRRRRLIS